MRRLVYANTFILICVAFTVATLIDLAGTVILVGDVGTTYAHLGTRLILCIFAAVSLLVFRHFKKLPFVFIMGIHFLVFLLFTVLYVWITGFFTEQHPRAMFYMVRSVLIVYPLIAIVCIIIDKLVRRRTSKPHQQ